MKMSTYNIVSDIIRKQSLKHFKSKLHSSVKCKFITVISESWICIITWFDETIWRSTKQIQLSDVTINKNNTRQIFQNEKLQFFD